MVDVEEVVDDAKPLLAGMVGSEGDALSGTDVGGGRRG